MKTKSAAPKVVFFGPATFVIERVDEDIVTIDVRGGESGASFSIRLRGGTDQVEELKNALEDADAQKEKS